MYGRGRGGGSRGRGRGRGGFKRKFDEGPPSYVIDIGTFMHPCEDEMVYKCVIDDKVPYFNAGVYLENKTKIGKIDEVFGPTGEVMFTVKPESGVVAKSFKESDKIFISPDKLLPKARFTDPSKASAPKRGGRGGRGGFSRGRGGRGGFSSPGRGRGRGGFRSPGRGRGRGRGRGGRW